MKIVKSVLVVCCSLICAAEAYAGQKTFGAGGHNGARLHWEGFNLGGKSSVRVQMECMKNWGGRSHGIAEVVGYYLEGDSLKHQTVTVSCSVSGGADGATKKKKGSTKSFVIPAKLEDIEVRAYVDQASAKNTDVWRDKVHSTVNSLVEDFSAGQIKYPLDPKKSLRELTAPTGGVVLEF